VSDTPTERVVKVLEAGLSLDIPDDYPDPPPATWSAPPGDVRPNRDAMPAMERGDWIDYAEYLELKLATAVDAIQEALELLGRTTPDPAVDQWAAGA
jgi:hypothetical protein